MAARTAANTNFNTPIGHAVLSGFGGYKPASRDLVGALFDNDDDDNDVGAQTTTGTEFGFPIPQQLQGYKPVSRSLLGGFSDDEEEEGGGEDIYNASDREDNDGGDSRNKRKRPSTEIRDAASSKTNPAPPNVRGEEQEVTNDDEGARRRGEIREMTLSDRLAALGFDPPQTNITVAFPRNQGSVASADLPGYFAPEDLRLVDSFLRR